MLSLDEEAHNRNGALLLSNTALLQEKLGKNRQDAYGASRRIRQDTKTLNMKNKSREINGQKQRR